MNKTLLILLLLCAAPIVSALGTQGTVYNPFTGKNDYVVRYGVADFCLADGSNCALGNSSGGNYTSWSYNTTGNSSVVEVFDGGLLSFISGTGMTISHVAGNITISSAIVDTYNTTQQMISATNNTLDALRISCGNITGATSNLCTLVDTTYNESYLTNYTETDPYYNNSWNQSLADTLYYPRNTNPQGFYNSSTLPADSTYNASYLVRTGDTSSGNYTFGNATTALFIDQTNGRVAINGTPLSGSELTINGGGDMILNADDEVAGISFMRHDTQGRALVRSSTNTSIAVFSDYTAGTGMISVGSSTGINEASPDATLEVSADGETSGNIFTLSPEDGADGGILTVTKFGLMGVGVTNPTSVLDVYGNMSLVADSTYANSSLRSLFIDGTNNRIGINTTTPSTTLHVVGSTMIQNSSGNNLVQTQDGSLSQIVFGSNTPDATLIGITPVGEINSVVARGVQFLPDLQANTSGSMSVALSGILRPTGGTMALARGLNGNWLPKPTNTGVSNNISIYRGSISRYILQSDYTGVIGTATGFYAEAPLYQGTGTITNYEGITVAATTAGTNSNLAYRGLIASGTNRWNLYMDGTADNYLAGNLGIGTTTPQGVLEVANSTNTHLFINSTTGNIGVGGIKNPTQILEVTAQEAARRGIAVSYYFDDTQSGNVNIRKARGTINSPTAPLAGDIIGGFGMQGYSGSAFVNGGFIRVVAVNNYNTTNSGSYMRFDTTPVGSTTIQERMRINANGTINIAGLTGSGNDYVCVDATGTLFRSNTAC